MDTKPYTPPGQAKAGGMQDKVVYLTAEGKHRFAAELHELVTVRRHEVEEQIRRAKEFSDTVDNAEYEEAKTDQAFVEGRIQELERLLASAKVIEAPTTRADFVRLGAHVKVVDREGEEETYYLVGKPEADPRRRNISNESPIGRALMGRRVGDEVTVVAPAGAFDLKILEIS
jgi:transcription elongation factor GreA